VTAIPANRRVPTGDLDRFLAIGLDATARPPQLVLSTFRRSAGDRDYRVTPQVITLQAQFIPILIERLEEAVRQHQERAG
jgi:hypothetical protein